MDSASFIRHQRERIRLRHTSPAALHVDLGGRHRFMATIMRSCKGKLMVSIIDHPDICHAVDGFHMLGLDIKYSVNNAAAGKAQTSRQLVITNWGPGTQNGGLF